MNRPKSKTENYDIMFYDKLNLKIKYNYGDL